MSGESPCPFCGFDTPIALDKMEGTTHYVHCPECGASGPERLSLNAAIEAWENAPRQTTLPRRK